MAVLKRAVKLLAAICRVDLVELAADDAEYDPALAADRFLNELEDTERFEQQVDRVHERLLDHVDEDRLGELASIRLDPADMFSDGVLVAEVERRGLDDRFDTGPLQAVERIDDDPRTVYLHLLDPSADEGAYADRLDKMYREQYGRSPRGLHVPLTELEELQEVDPAYFTQQAAPWLNEAESGDAATAGGDA